MAKKPQSTRKSSTRSENWGGKRPNTGGARPGAGRKPKEITQLRTDYGKQACEIIGPDLPLYLATMKDIAIGHRAMDDEGRVYTTSPDRQALEYLLNRVLGKPTERSEVTGKDGSDLLQAFEKKARKIYPK